MNESIHGPQENDRIYFGVFTVPYSKYIDKAEENNGKRVDACYDQMIDGKPHVYSWRFWGKNAENILNFLEKDKENEIVNKE